MADFRTQLNGQFLNEYKDYSHSKESTKSLPLQIQESHKIYNNVEHLESVLCVPGSRLVMEHRFSQENVVKFINVGGEAIKEQEDVGVFVTSDNGFEGGDVLRTNENIVDGDHFGALYQSARVGNFSYQFNRLPSGDYFIDLLFAEIIYIHGPKGLRVFDVFIQEKKVVYALDIYSIVGANRPLQVEDIQVTVGGNGLMVIRFEGVNGSPIVSGICIKEAPRLPASQVFQNNLENDNFVSKNKYESERTKAIHERKMEELQQQCEQKTHECYQAWMSLTEMNKELEEIKMELDRKSFKNHCLDQAMVLQAENLKDISNKYEFHRRFCVEVINNLELKIKIMKDEHSKLAQVARECASSIPDFTKMVLAIQGLVAQYEDLKVKYNQEQAERKKLYNQIQETRGNIRVFCRCRPLGRAETLAGYTTLVDFGAAKDGDLGIITNASSSKKTFKFDRVYTPKDDQVDVFADASPLVISVLDGYNVCIFAYGQTGTGKTFTMEGPEQNRGVNYRTLELLFQMAEKRKEIFIYNISFNVLEVYNEQIRDLLATAPASKKLEIRQVSDGINHVPGIVNAEVENVEEAWNVLQAGSNARAVGSNNVNEHSSRSHCLICIMVRAKNTMNGECTNSKLWLVDLAGSERLAKTDVQGERLKEAQNINRSLSALGDVISALAAKSNHIPYRNSKLTHLLQDSLGGDSKALMFVQISPLEQDLGETLSSLNFATRVRGIELGPAKKQVDIVELQKLKLLLDKAKQESRAKDEALQKLEENNREIESKAKSKDQLCRNQQDKLTEVETQLGLKSELCKQMERQMSQLSVQMRDGEDVRKNLQQKVNELEKRMKECNFTESNMLKFKVKDLEKTLEGRTREFEAQTVVLQEKIKELELKLEKQGGVEAILLHPKIQEPEEKMTKCDKELNSSLQICSIRKSSPKERKALLSITDNEVHNNALSQTLKSSSSLPRPAGGESVLLKGSESLSYLRKKREHQNRGIENNFLLANSIPDRKVIQTESYKGRHIDPSKAFARVTRTSKPFSGSQKSSLSRIMNSEQAAMSKDRDRSTRVWV